MARVVKKETQIRNAMQKIVDEYGVQERIDKESFIIQPATSLVKSWIELTQDGEIWTAQVKDGKVMKPTKAFIMTFD